MPRYRVKFHHETTEVVEAENQYMAAVVANDSFAGCEVINVTPAVGRPRSIPDSDRGVAPTRAAQRRRRRAMSPKGSAHDSLGAWPAASFDHWRRMGIRKLQSHATKQGVRGAYRMRKTEIIDALAAMAPTD